MLHSLYYMWKFLWFWKHSFLLIYTFKEALAISKLKIVIKMLLIFSKNGRISWGFFEKFLKEMAFGSLQYSWCVLNLLVFERLCSYTVCSYKKNFVYFFFCDVLRSWFLSLAYVDKNLKLHKNGFNNLII